MTKDQKEQALAEARAEEAVANLRAGATKAGGEFVTVRREELIAALSLVPASPAAPSEEPHVGTDSQ